MHCSLVLQPSSAPVEGLRLRGVMGLGQYSTERPALTFSMVQPRAIFVDGFAARMLIRVGRAAKK